jgi:hypothetical protein
VVDRRRAVAARDGMTRRRAIVWGITALLLTLSVLMVVLAFYPGLTTPDSNQTWSQALGHYALDWWTPVGTLALRAWFRVGLSLADVWIVQNVVFVLGAWWLLRHRLPDPWAAAGAMLVTGWPPTYSQLTEIAREGFYMGFALVALGALAAAYRTADGQHRRRWALLAGSVVAAMASYLSRQNGVVVVIGVVLAALLLVAGSRIAALGRWRRVGGAVAVALATGLVAFGFSSATNRVFGVKAAHPERMLYVYDLASISKSSGHDYFPASLVRHPNPGWVTPVVTQRAIDRNFNWVNVIAMYPGGPSINFLDTAGARREASELRSAWRRAVLAHPDDYLWTRLRLTAGIVGLSQYPTNAFYGLLEPTNYGRPMQHWTGVRWAADVIRPFVGPTASIPLDIHWPYLLVSIGLLVFLWRRRPSDRPLLLAIAISQWANLIVDFLFAPAASYSYLDLSPPLTLVLGLWAIHELLPSTRRASGGA